jgi:hypothetical protein
MQLSQQDLLKQFQTLPFSSATTLTSQPNLFCTRIGNANNLTCFQPAAATIPDQIKFTSNITTFYYKRLSPNIIIGNVLKGEDKPITASQFCVLKKDPNQAEHAFYYSKIPDYLDQLMLSSNPLQFNTTFTLFQSNIVVAVLLNTNESQTSPVFSIQTVHDNDLSADDKKTLIDTYTAYFKSTCSGTPAATTPDS